MSCMQIHHRCSVCRYITVSKEAQRALFYALVEASDVDPDQAPLVLWLNGWVSADPAHFLFIVLLFSYYYRLFIIEI